MRHVCTVIGCKREFEKASHRNQHEKDAHQSEPAQVSQPVAEICSGFALHWFGSGAIAPIIEKHNLKVGDKLFSSPPDYEALKVENNLLKEVEKGFADLSENLQKDCAALKTENEELKDDLQFVERWANHHAIKPNVSAQEALSCIQHYPSIRAITESYKDGAIPTTRNPYAENEALKLRVAELESESRTKHEYAMQMLGERDRLQSECNLLKEELNAWKIGYGSKSK